jgi:hypothetical protein
MYMYSILLKNEIIDNIIKSILVIHRHFLSQNVCSKDFINEWK